MERREHFDPSSYSVTAVGAYHVGRESGFCGAHLHPADGLTGVLGVSFGQAAVGAPAAILQKALDVVHDALLVALVQKDAGAGAALGNGLRFFLEHGNGGALLKGRQGRRHPAGSGADHYDIVGFLFAELRDGFNLDG